MEPIVPVNEIRKPGVYQGAPSSPEKKDAPVVRVIRTMKNDATEAISKQNETAASIALAEAKKIEKEHALALAAKQNETGDVVPVPKRHGRFFIVVMLFLILIVGGVVYKLIATKLAALPSPSPSTNLPAPTNTLPPSQPIIQLAPAIITPQSEMRFVLNNETPDHVSAKIAVERTSGLTQGTIKNFYFSEIPNTGAQNPIAVSPNRIFAFLGMPVPDLLLRSLDAPMMVGLIGESGSLATPFIILKISDYNTALAGMLTWEPTLAQGFDRLFGTKIGAGASNTAKFLDIVIAERDARIFTPAPNTAIAYAFANQNTLVITASRSALEELLPELARK